MKIELLSYQHEFLQSNSKKTLLLGGIGSGKSFTGAHFVLKMVADYPNSKGIITANTYTQLMQATVATISSVLDELSIPYNLIMSGPRKRIEIADSLIYLYSLETPDNIRGIEAGWWLSDESCFSKIEAIQIVRGRLRDSNGPLYERHTSSPNGFNWAYNEFENKDKNFKTNGVHLVRGKTIENIFLPEEYYQSLLEDYGGEDNPLAKQELMGEFVNLQAGAIYWGFERGINVEKVTLDKDFPVYVGQDFNIDNMANCYVQFRNGKFYVFKETILDNYGANTDNAASKIVKDLSGYNVVVIPDSTGKARKTSSSGRTDIEILRSYGLNVVETKNPFVRDRQNTLNMHFKKNDVIIDPSCINIIRELETLSNRDKEGECAHVSVALGYVTYKLKPLRERKRSTYTGGGLSNGTERFYPNNFGPY